VAPALQRLGHDVTVYSPDAGETEALARERGIRVVTSERDLPDTCDAVLVQDTVLALELRERYDVPHVFVSHGAELDLAAPPQLDGAVAAAVAMNDRVAKRLTALAVDIHVVRLRQPIDIEVFCPRGPPRERPEQVLLLGNYLTSRRRDALVAVCSELGLRAAQVGVGGEVLANPTEAIARADIVVGYGRSVLEAMACGRAAYVLDYLGGDGWVTADSYDALERDGFTGTTTDRRDPAAALRRDLLAYDASMGDVNRTLIYSHHTAFEHARQLGELFKSLVGTSVERFTAGRELARLVRSQWHADWRASQLWHELDEQGAALRAQERRAAEAEQRAALAERRFEQLVATRRWRLVTRLLRPLDRARIALRRSRSSRSRS